MIRTIDEDDYIQEKRNQYRDKELFLKLTAKPRWNTIDDHAKLWQIIRRYQKIIGH